MSPHIDLPSLQERCMHQEMILQKLLHCFQQTATDSLATLRRDLAAGRTQAIRDAAHSLKGAAASISAGQVRQDAARLESAAAAGDLDLCTPCLQHLDQSLKDCLKEIQQELLTTRMSS